MHWIILAAALFMDVQMAEGNGQLSIKFLSYQNSRGKGANGHCCDGRSFFCTSACDHKFLICVDTFHGDGDFSHCAIGKKSSSRISNRNVINFGSTIADLRNPVILAFTSLQVPGVKVKVKVVDDDSFGSDDFVDDLRKQIGITPASSAEHARVSSVTLSHRTTLKVELKAWCDANWYGDACGTHCSPTNNDHGHYTCDSNTGDKICRPGWAGGSCTQNINECGSSPCLNGAECRDEVNAYTCQCVHGFTGTVCQTKIDYCENVKCENNGSCVSNPTGYQCECSAKYTGMLCEEVIAFCHDASCPEGEMCEETGNGFRCLPGLTTTSEVSTITVLNVTTTSNTSQGCNLSNPCLHNSTCVYAGGLEFSHCICQDGWYGVYCEIPDQRSGCSLHPCLHNATCIPQNESYTCQCPHLYTGPRCELQLSVCDMGPCQNNATCRPLPGDKDFFCICPENWIGQFCEVSLEDAMMKACDGTHCQNNGTCVVTMHVMNTSKSDDTTDTISTAADVNDTSSTDSRSESILLSTEASQLVNQHSGFIEKETGRMKQKLNAKVNFEHKETEEENFIHMMDETTAVPSMPKGEEEGLVYSEAKESLVLETVCACTEEYQGAYCESRVVTNVTFTEGEFSDDDQFVDMRKKFKEYPSALLFEHKLSDQEIKDIADTIRQILSSHLGVEPSEVDVQYDVRRCLSATKEEVAAFLFDVYVKDTVVAWEIIDKAFGLVSEAAVTDFLPAPLYDGETCTPLDGTLDYQKVQQKPWLTRNWYLIAIFCILLLAGISAVVYAIFRYKRHTKKAVISDYPILAESGDSTETSLHQPNLQTNGDYFFENKVYEYEEIPDNK